MGIDINLIHNVLRTHPRAGDSLHGAGREQALDPTDRIELSSRSKAWVEAPRLTIKDA